MALSVPKTPDDKFEIVAIIVSVSSAVTSSKIARVIVAVSAPSVIEKVVAPVV